jgi:hypothetical protein
MNQDELVNRRVHAIARAHDCSIDEVHAALDRHPIELNRDAYLKRTLALELMRLDQLEMAFEGKARPVGLRRGTLPRSGIADRAGGLFSPA